MGAAWDLGALELECWGWGPWGWALWRWWAGSELGSGSSYARVEVLRLGFGVCWKLRSSGLAGPSGGFRALRPGCCISDLGGEVGASGSNWRLVLVFTVLLHQVTAKIF